MTFLYSGHLELGEFVKKEINKAIKLTEDDSMSGSGTVMRLNTS